MDAQSMAEKMNALFGIQLVSVQEMNRRFKALGYTLDRTMDCRSTARFMTGELAGVSYPCCTTGLRETDTGLSAWNVDARRDANYRAMQKLRSEIIAISRNAILEV